MGLAGDWGRQTARAAGVSLIAPVALLGAAAVIALGGGVLGGLGSLTQIASGPSLPEADVGALPRSTALGRAQVVSLDLGPAGAVAGAPGPITAGSAPSAGPGGGAGPGGDDVAVSPGGPQRGSSGGGQPPGGGAPVPGGPAPAAPAVPTPATPGPGSPVGDVVDTTRDLGESLPGPVGPTVDDTLDSVLGPRP